MLSRPAWLRREPPLPEPYPVRTALGTLVTYVLIVLGVATVSLLVEVGLGDPWHVSHGLGGIHAAEDAGWHLLTGLAAAMAVRRKAILLATPLLALAIDVDHVFGLLLPAVIGRQDHSLLFAAVLTAVLYRAFGPRSASLALGATWLHLGLDGGSFPLLAPGTTATYPIPFAAAALLVASGVVLVGLADRSPRELLRPAFAVPATVVVVALIALGTLIPWIQVFSGT